jgi:predicted Zn-dependent protease with MMP-like domain
MKREHFVNVVEDSLDSLPEEFRSRIKNVAILVEDFPPKRSPPQPGQQRRLLLGIFHGVPATNKSVFDLTDRSSPHRALPKEHRGRLFERGRSPPANPANADTRTGALFRHD